MGSWADVRVFGSTPAGAQAIVRPSAYGIVNDGAQVLAVVRTPQGLFLLGGGMEPHELPQETVVRESLEECGLAVEIGAWVARAVDFWYSASDHVVYEKRSTFVDAMPIGLPVAGQEPDHELVWMDVEQAAAELAHPSHRWAVSQW